MPLRLPPGFQSSVKRLNALPTIRKRRFLADLARLLHTMEPNYYLGIDDLFAHRKRGRPYSRGPEFSGIPERDGPLELPFAPHNRHRLVGQPLVVFHAGQDLSKATIQPGLHTGTREAAQARIDLAPFERGYLNELEIIPRTPLGSPRKPLKDYIINLFEDMRDPDVVDAVDEALGDLHYHKAKAAIRDKGFARLNEIYNRKRPSPFDSVFYKNEVEDAGSVSVDILDPSIIRNIKAIKRESAPLLRRR